MLRMITVYLFITLFTSDLTAYKCFIYYYNPVVNHRHRFFTVVMTYSSVKYNRSTCVFGNWWTNEPLKIITSKRTVWYSHSLATEAKKIIKIPSLKIQSLTVGN